MTNRMTAILCTAVMFILPDLFGKEPKDLPKDLDLTQRYFLSECVFFRHCVEKVLNPAGAAGYRFVAGDIWESYDYESDDESARFLVVMEKTGEPGTTYEYVESPRTDEGLNEAARRGFRLVSRFPVEGWTIRNENFTCLLEKPSNVDLHYEYRVLSQSKFLTGVKVSGLFGQMEADLIKGYRVVQFKKTAHGYAAVMERATGEQSESPPIVEDSSSPPSLPRFQLLSAWKTSTLRKEMAAAAGYRLVAADLDALELLLEKATGSSHGIEYEAATGRLWSTIERNMNEIAAKGFRLHPCSRGISFIVLERSPGAMVSYQYQILETARLSTMRKELAKAAGKGFAVVMAIEHDAGKALVLERRRGPGEP